MEEQKPTIMELALAWKAKKEEEKCSPDHIKSIHYFIQNYVGPGYSPRKLVGQENHTRDGE